MKRQLLFILPLVAMFLTGFTALAPQGALAQQVTKSCGACGAAVSSVAQVGDQCPACGVYWSDEQTTVVTEPSYADGGSDRAYVRPLTPLDAVALWRLSLFQQQQMEREQRIEQLQVRRQAEQAARDRNRQRLAEQLAQWRATNDPAENAANYIRSAIACEQRGQYAAAAAYYRLALRTLPHSEQALLGLAEVELR